MSEKIDDIFPLGEAIRLSRDWLQEHGRRINQNDILAGVGDAVMLIGATFEDWNSSTDAEKEAQSVALASLMIASDLIRGLFEEGM